MELENIEIEYDYPKRMSDEDCLAIKALEELPIKITAYRNLQDPEHRKATKITVSFARSLLITHSNVLSYIGLENLSKERYSVTLNSNYCTEGGKEGAYTELEIHDKKMNVNFRISK